MGKVYDRGGGGGLMSLGWYESMNSNCLRDEE